MILYRPAQLPAPIYTVQVSGYSQVKRCAHTHLDILALDHCNVSENPGTMFSVYHCVSDVVLFPASPSSDVFLTFVRRKSLGNSDSMRVIAHCRSYALGDVKGCLRRRILKQGKVDI